MFSLLSSYCLLSLAIVASSHHVQQSHIIESPVAQTAFVHTPIVDSSPVLSSPDLVEPQLQELPLDVQLPSLVDDTEQVSIGNSPTYLKEFSMTDHLFPSFKKISSSFSTGASKFKSVLPGNPFKKWAIKSDDVEIIEEIPVAKERVDQIPVAAVNERVDPITVAKERLDPITVAKERVDPIPYKFNSEIPKKLIAKAAALGQAQLTKLTAGNKGKLSEPGSLEANLKVNHPIVGKQTAKIKLLTA